MFIYINILVNQLGLEHTLKTKNYSLKSLINWLFTACWQLGIDVFCSLYVLCIITAICYGRFDIFDVGSVEQIGDRGSLLLEINHRFKNTLRYFHVILYPLLAFFTLDGWRTDFYSKWLLLLTYG